MGDRTVRIMLSAGETSGDRLGAGLAKALLRRRPDLELFGMGGPRMADAGVRLIQDASEVSVVGLLEVLARLPTLQRAMNRLQHGLVSERPDLLVPIDFPDFNLRLATRAGRAGVPVVYYVSPQVWAWRKGRVHKIRRLVERMLVLFPFESSFYESAGVPVDFVGYPVEPLEQPDREALCSRVGLDPSRPVVALLPGSRQGEIERQLPRMLAAARCLQSERPELQFVIPRAPGLPDEWLEQRVQSELPQVRVWEGDYPAILRICRVGVVASGTATLDAALSGLPIVVVYCMNALSYSIARRLVNLDNVALPNLIAGRRLFPELIQKDFNAQAIVAELTPWLDDDRRYRQICDELKIVRERLESRDAFERAAESVLAELARREPSKIGTR